MKNLLFVVIGVILGASAYAHEGSHESVKEKTVKVEISEAGFKPAKIKAHKGEELVLLVTRKTDKTCMMALKKVDGSGQVKLPLNKETRFNVGQLNKVGEIKLLCGMDMKAGVVSVL